ncbi:MAG: endonuclease/exonuclease/phosphatase family protein [Oligoflexia bacterium]|nr:endonuclease/exonuclease/phosphatase family protein [Oligoflexia bacterium]
MKIATWNCCLGIAYKKDLISDLLTNFNIDILCIQECEIDPNNLIAYSIKDYSLEISKCTPKARSCIYIKKDVNYERVNFGIDHDQEIICIKYCNFLLTNYYRTFKIPHNHTHITHFNNALSMFQQIFEVFQHLNIQLVGDFNIDFSKYLDQSYNKKVFFENMDTFLDNFNLAQIVDKPTWHRVVNGQLRESTLDHIYVNHLHLISRVEQHYPGVGDHNVIVIDISVEFAQKNLDTVFIRDWRKYSKDRIVAAYEAIEIKTLGILNVQESYDLIEGVINRAFNVVCPIVPVRNKHRGTTWSLRIIELKKRRANLFKSYKHGGNASALERCRALDRLIKNLMIKERKDKMHEHLGNFKNSKSLWLGVKEILNHEIITIPNKIKHGDMEISGSENQAEAFASYFTIKQKAS